MKALFSVPTAGLTALFIAVAGAFTPAPAMQFKLPQEGYHPAGPKRAYLEDVPEGVMPKVYVFDAVWKDKLEIRNGRTVYKVKPENIRVQRDNKAGPGLNTLVVDFSEFDKPGAYELRIDGSETKEPITVSEYVYWDLLKPVVKTFYFQRCGQDIEDVKKNFFHLACHKDDAVLKNERSDIDTAGGWHDGADYAKHATSTSIATAKLLSVYELSPKAFRYFKMDYPYWEKGSGSMSDMLLETRVGLDWLMAMQEQDGGVYSKVAGLAWPKSDVAPNDDEADRFIYGVTSQDTAAAAAAFAIAARAYKGADLGYAVRNLMAAQRSWKYLDQHPNVIRNDARAKDDSTLDGSADYVLRDAASDDLSFRVWAATELYLSTGDEKYHQYFLKNYKNVPFETRGWRNPAISGFINYVLSPEKKDAQAQVYIKDNLLKFAGRILADSEKTPYGSGLREFSHESNYQLLERTGILLTAYQLTQENKYREAATQALDYLFGINPLDQTYLTGIGKNPVKRPAHRMMVATEKLIEGYVVSGPDSRAADGRTPQGLGAASYKDDRAAWSVNTPNILYNASLAYVLGGLNAAYNLEPVAPNAPKKTTREKLEELNANGGKKKPKNKK